LSKRGIAIEIQYIKGGRDLGVVYAAHWKNLEIMVKFGNATLSTHFKIGRKNRGRALFLLSTGGIVIFY
jgi:hypothetical protein